LMNAVGRKFVAGEFFQQFVFDAAAREGANGGLLAPHQQGASRAWRAAPGGGDGDQPAEAICRQPVVQMMEYLLVAALHAERFSSDAKADPADVVRWPRRSRWPAPVRREGRRVRPRRRDRPGS